MKISFPKDVLEKAEKAWEAHKEFRRQKEGKSRKQMSYQEIMEKCFEEIDQKSQQALISQIEFTQWYRRAFDKILAEKGLVTQEDMEQAFIHRNI